MSEKLPVLLVQMGRPPVDIRNVVGDQASWFEAALKHPEFHPSMMNKIIASRSERAALKGKDKQALLSEVSGTPEARAILQRFVLPSA